MAHEAINVPDKSRVQIRIVYGSNGLSVPSQNKDELVMQGSSNSRKTHAISPAFGGRGANQGDSFSGQAAVAAKHTDKQFQSNKRMREQLIHRKKSMESSRSHSFGSSESDHPNTVTNR